MKEIILNIKGMVCNGCENRVQNVLKDIEGVEEVKANHENGTVIINCKEDISVDVLKEKIEDIGFEVIKED